MNRLDQRVCAWGGVFCAVFIGAGLLLAGFVPPPAPSLSAEEIATLYRENASSIRVGMILALTGIAGYAALVGVISVQMRRMQCNSRLASYLQLGAGSIGILTVMFPIMIFAITAFRPERDAAMTLLLNDVGWLLIIPAFPTFIAQFGGIAMGVLQDRSARAVYPRWAAYLNVWVAILFIPGAFAYMFRTGPFAWNGLLAFWLAASAFFVWLITMTFLTLRAIGREDRDVAATRKASTGQASLEVRSEITAGPLHVNNGSIT